MRVIYWGQTNPDDFKNAYENPEEPVDWDKVYEGFDAAVDWYVTILFWQLLN